MAEKDLETKDLKIYEVAIQQAHNESQVVWQYSESYILANTILLGFIAQNSDNASTNLLLSIVGFIISLIWLGSAERRWGWYEFRMAQAREKEKNIKGVDLVRDKGHKFSKGEQVIVDKKGYQLNWLARKFNTSLSTRFFIILFMFIYLVLSYFNQPYFSFTLNRSFHKGFHPYSHPIFLIHN